MPCFIFHVFHVSVSARSLTAGRIQGLLIDRFTLSFLKKKKNPARILRQEEHNVLYNTVGKWHGAQG